MDTFTLLVGFVVIALGAGAGVAMWRSMMFQEKEEKKWANQVADLVKRARVG